MGDQEVWNNQTEVIDGDRCGTKTCNIDRDHRNNIKNCVRESVVRIFLKLQNTEAFVAKLIQIEPREFYDYLLEIPLERIQNNFFTVCSEVQQYLLDNRIETVKLFIEKGEATVGNAVHDNAFDLDEHQTEIMIRNIFSILNKLHSIGVIHADIKPENFLFCRRANRQTLVLNDFDTSFIIPQNRTHITLNDSSDILGVTPGYAAPEQFGVYGYTIGEKTDVYSAAMIAYVMLNARQHPLQYRDFKEGRKTIREIFQDMKKDGIEFEPCQRGSEQLRSAISKALSINPDERPSALQFILTLKFPQAAVQNEPATEILPKPDTKEDKPEPEPNLKQTEREDKTVNKYENHENNHNTYSDDHSKHSTNQGAVIIALVAVIAIVVLGVVALSKFSSDTNVTTNVSVSANLKEDTDKPEILTEYITTLSSTATTEAYKDTVQAETKAETEKKTILLQQL